MNLMVRIYYVTVERWPVFLPCRAKPDHTRKTIEVSEEMVQRWQEAKKAFDAAQEEMRAVAAQQGVYDPTDM